MSNSKPYDNAQDLRSANKINQFIGSRIKAIRIAQSLTKAELARRIGITYQQLSNYENAKSSITVERLYAVSQILNAEIMFFLPKQKDITEH